MKTLGISTRRTPASGKANVGAIRRAAGAAGMAVGLAALGACGGGGMPIAGASTSTAPAGLGAPASLSSGAGATSTVAEAPPHAPSAPAAPVAPTLIRVQGCVLDDLYLPRGDVKVRALDVQGRLLGHATSRADGGFQLDVTPVPVLTLAVDRDGGDRLRLRTAMRDARTALCLVEGDPADPPPRR